MPIRPSLLAALLILSPAMHAQTSAQTSAPMQAQAPECGLAAPPVDAGVDRHLGALLRIHPRNPDIGAAYAGCQTLWAQDGDGWAIVTVAHYQAGRVAWIESPLLARDPMAECRFDQGVLVRGDPELCAGLDELRFESAPAACLREADDHGSACVRE